MAWTYSAHTSEKGRPRHSSRLHQVIKQLPSIQCQAFQCKIDFRSDVMQWAASAPDELLRLSSVAALAVKVRLFNSKAVVIKRGIQQSCTKDNQANQAMWTGMQPKEIFLNFAPAQRNHGTHSKVGELVASARAVTKYCCPRK